jgi:hypothetical protein
VSVPARCRMISRREQCTGEAVDPLGEILICRRHLALAIELLAAHGYTVLAPESSSRPHAGVRS